MNDLSGDMVCLPQLPVLNYHHVHDERESFFRVTPDILHTQLEGLLAEGYIPLHPDQLIDWKGRARPQERYALISFDDAYEDFLLYAWPILKRLQIPTLLFVISDYVGGWNDWDPLRPSRQRHLDVDQLRTLQSEGVVFGSHSRSHALLPRLDDAALLAEIAGSKHTLEDLFGQPIHTFAYPGGHVDRRVRDVTARYYELGFATGTDHTRPLCDAYMIARFDPCFYWDLDKFKAQLSAHAGGAQGGQAR